MNEPSLPRHYRLPTHPPDPLPDSRRPDMLDRSVLVLTLCVWLAQFVLLTSHTILTTGRIDDPERLLSRAVVCGAAILLCLGMYVLLRRRAVAQPWHLFFRAIALSLVSGALLVLVNVYSARYLTNYYELNPQDWMHPPSLSWLFLGQLWMLATWSALYVGATLILEMRQRDAQLAAARESAQHAQLLALRLQINPHFLFNTLNMLAGLIALERKGESEQIVLSLSKFLRQTLVRTPMHLVPLSDEMQILQTYLDIEKARFPDRLEIRYDVPEDTRGLLVPSLILLPLAENSIKYALGQSERGITIRMTARNEGALLMLCLEDDGDPIEGEATGLGIGLGNVRKQLQALYGDAARMHCGRTGSGWRNRLWIPSRAESE